MSQDISTKEMYNIINYAISKSYNHAGDSVCEDMEAFSKKHWELITHNHQTDAFAEPIPTTKEVRDALKFCRDLDEHRQSCDVYNENATEPSDITYRSIYKGLERYRPYITEEAKHCFTALEKYIRGRLPEFRLEEHMKEYNSRATGIFQAKKEVDKKKRKKESYSRAYEELACQYFSDFLSDKELHSAPSSVEKLTVYSNALKIVDCLPDSKYRKTEKFRLKYQLNESIFNICEGLGDNYALAKINAQNEMIKFMNAIDNAKRHLEEQNTMAGFKARQRRKREEYLYK